MQPCELVTKHPRLYHMAEPGSWPSIREHGLLTTAQLVERYPPDAAERAAILDHPRRKPYELDGGRVVVRDRHHDVLVLDTATLLARYADRVRLTTMNTGATTRFPNCPRRGRDTFMTIADFPLGERRTTDSRRTRVVELAVTDGVPDVADLVLPDREAGRTSARHDPGTSALRRFRGAERYGQCSPT